MQVTKTMDGTKLTVAVEGRIDTVTAPVLDEEVKKSIDGVTELIFDFAKVEYISSSGLRVLLAALKIMNRQGTMEVHNVNSMLMEIFEVTGFQSLLTIK